MKKWLAFGASLALTLCLIYLGNSRFGSVPPLGKFFSPGEGFWQNAEEKTRGSSKELKLVGLKDRVKVLFDNRQVPHIFAKNNHDLYYAFGYITAKNRLWQMEIQARAAAGRLAEIVGPKALRLDLYYRQMGLLESCRATLKKLDSYKNSKAVMDAYTGGVNDYIHSLSPRDYPLEYKILDYRPEAWSPLKSILLLKLMAWRLSGRHFQEEINMSRLLRKFPFEKLKDLFGNRREKEPVIPPGTPWHFTPIQGKQPPESFFSISADYPLYFDAFPPSEGSNNWAVSGKKTKTGAPLLASDPHLLLTLPSIWYEAQLVSPDVNVYGVSIPGSPVILIGFNSDIAWGLTNSEVDVADLYEVKFKDDSRKEYLYKGQWKKSRIVVEKIEVRGKKTRTFEVIYTHHGPVIFYSKGLNKGLALRWTGHGTSNELKTFLGLNRAKNYSDYVKALSYYDCPAQNFVFACRNGDIALWHNGKIPLKWPGQGLFVSRGDNPLYEWSGFIPRSQLPHVKNPPRGFVSSANQYPVDKTYPYFLGSFLFEEYRNKRINEVLRKNNQITPEDFQRLQGDLKNLHAESILPYLLELIQSSALSEREKDLYKILKGWDFYHRSDAIAPTIFTEWWKRLYHSVWEDDFGKGPYPSIEKTGELLKQNKSTWIDDRNTPKVERAGDLALLTFQQTCRFLWEKYGPTGEKWRWGRVKPLRIAHIGRIPGLGKKLFIGGWHRTVNAIVTRTGPSWRMIVSLEKKGVRAWGVYPGGQSGNPGSAHYDDFVDSWAKGKYYPLVYLKKPALSHPKIQSIWTLEGR